MHRWHAQYLTCGCVQIYKNMDHPDVRAVLPRRTSLASDRGVLIVAHATHKLKAMFFVLIQVS